MLTLDARATVSLSTDDALEIEAFDVNLAHAYGCLGRDRGSRNPHGTTQMHPLVQGLRWHSLTAFQPLLIPLQEEGVVLRDFSNRLRLKEVQINVVLSENFTSFFCLQDESFLEVTFTAEDLREGMVLVFSVKELQALLPARACLSAHD